MLSEWLTTQLITKHIQFTNICEPNQQKAMLLYQIVSSASLNLNTKKKEKSHTTLFHGPRKKSIAHTCSFILLIERLC